MLQRLMSRAPQRARPWPVVNRELTSATTPSNLLRNNSFIVSMTQSGDAELMVPGNISWKRRVKGNRSGTRPLAIRTRDDCALRLAAS